MNRDKLLIELTTETVLSRAVSAFVFSGIIDEVVVVTATGEESFSDCKVVKGGDTRLQSSFIGINAAKGDIVLIHDAARPFVTQELIKRIVECVKEHRSAVPCIPVKDSIKEICDGKIVASPDRGRFFAAQTPQGFFKEDILAAYEAYDGQATDDSEVYAAKFGAPYAVMGEDSNIKLTTPSDLAASSKSGIGYDLHRLEMGRPLYLGGIKIDSPKGAVAHSDGDCLLHAIIDGMFAAAGLKDIGTHYPDTAKEYAGVSSITLLKDARARIRERGFSVDTVGGIIVLDTPKLKGYIDDMKKTISSVLSVPAEKISISAKTTELTSPDTVECFSICLLK